MLVWIFGVNSKFPWQQEQQLTKWLQKTANDPTNTKQRRAEDESSETWIRRGEGFCFIVVVVLDVFKPFFSLIMRLWEFLRSNIKQSTLILDDTASQKTWSRSGAGEQQMVWSWTPDLLSVKECFCISDVKTVGCKFPSWLVTSSAQLLPGNKLNSQMPNDDFWRFRPKIYNSYSPRVFLLMLIWIFTSLHIYFALED